jgi:hypothetical protein
MEQSLIACGVRMMTLRRSPQTDALLIRRNYAKVGGYSVGLILASGKIMLTRAGQFAACEARLR